MKKIAIVLLSISLLFGGFSTAPVQAETLNETIPKVESMSISMEVSDTRLYRVGETIHSTIYYNKLGWSGTLTLFAVMPEPGNANYYRAAYKGTVFCSGNCIAPTSIQNEE
ncbi:hypothetical protein P9B03_07560 [Metasolibacillus meyeri]|uniref:Uncharacterized protein n=1 Tax=Metasolibacillus meyeri TaxID=1071052 RepID=A0AAW9NRI2_9BACL|nr:hypothetical protein [Metasolibacillus meyeri]MEC1178334.1 hypothetical protein [Metasolibacillus meyeri]